MAHKKNSFHPKKFLFLNVITHKNKIIPLKKETFLNWNEFLVCQKTFFSKDKSLKIQCKAKSRLL